MALMHQQQPLLYRHQEVLAASGSSLQTDIEELGKIVHFLLTSQLTKQPHDLTRRSSDASSHIDVRDVGSRTGIIISSSSRISRFISSQESLLHPIHKQMSVVVEEVRFGHLLVVLVVAVVRSFVAWPQIHNTRQ
jgi:hypothetical protein